MTLNPPAAQYRHSHDKGGTEHVVRQQKDGEVHSWPANFEDSGTDGAVVHGAQPEGAKLRVLDLFSGIGGFSLGLERATLPGAEINGFETVAFCEIESFPRKVLAKHWPDVPCYDDVRTLTGAQCGRVDVITAGFPCQDISLSGRGEGIAGERSGLWSEVARLVGELRPSFVILENSPALLVRGFDVVLSDLAALGYDAQWHCIPAAYVGAAHLRDRIWIVAYPMQVGELAANNGRVDWQILYQAEWPEVADATGGHVAWAPEPDVDRVANGLPNIVDRRSALGNAVVPQIPELIGNAILQSLHDTRGDFANRNAPALSGFVPFHSTDLDPEVQRNHGA